MAVNPKLLKALSVTGIQLIRLANLPEVAVVVIRAAEVIRAALVAQLKELLRFSGVPFRC